MTPKRGDRAAPPPRPGQWSLRFEDSDSVHGWENLCKQAPGNTYRAWEAFTMEPRDRSQHERQHRLHGEPGTRRRSGRDLEQWQYEVTGGGRIWYLIDDVTHTLWLTYAGTGHPKATD